MTHDPLGELLADARGDLDKLVGDTLLAGIKSCVEASLEPGQIPALMAPLVTLCSRFLVEHKAREARWRAEAEQRQMRLVS